MIEQTDFSSILFSILSIKWFPSEQINMSPFSTNRCVSLYRMDEHNLKKMLDQGLHVTVNSDDPACFGGYIEENFAAVQQALNLNREDIYALARNSIEAAFLTAEEKQVVLST